MSINIAVIGAGLSGIGAAAQLQRQGYQVRVFDKARGPGGRMSYKHSVFGGLDLGAQYCSPQTAAFAQTLNNWQQLGWVAPWTPRLYSATPKAHTPLIQNQELWVGTPNMSGPIQGLAAALAIQYNCRITSLQQQGSRWHLVDSNAVQHGPFDAVLISIPAPQASVLLSSIPECAGVIEQPKMEPVWAVALGFAAPLVTPVEACLVTESPLTWCARNNSKPARDSRESWVLHAASDWSQRYLEDTPESVIQALTRAFAQIIGSLPEPSFSIAHRWLYGRATQATPVSDAQAQALGIFICGDWCLGTNLEDAWHSGQHAAALLATQYPLNTH